VVSLGGATEASIWSILYRVGEVGADWRSIPYGFPLRGQSFAVLDEQQEPRPVWVPGELYIGGEGVARGYWGDEERTRSSFVEISGERRYRTGDLGRYLPDGAIEFLGREDTQVKLQGHRIELGEIEAVLGRHPGVRAAAVAAVGEERGARRPRQPRQLVAYVVAAAAGSGAAATARPSGHGTAPPPAAAPPSPPWAAPALPPALRAAAAPPALPAPALAPPRRDAIAKLEWMLREPGLRADCEPRQKVQLPLPALDESVLQPYRERRSCRDFDSALVPLDRLGGVLAALSPLRLDEFPFPKYRYPSAGNLYPVQTYLYAKPDRIGGLAGGIYYYHPKDHALILLAEGGRIDRAHYAPINQPVFDRAAFALFLVARADAIVPIYPGLAYEFCCLESGYMGQLLMTAGPGIGIGFCPIGGLDFAPLRLLFALDERCVLIHSLLGGAMGSEAAIASGHDQAAPARPAPASPARSASPADREHDPWRSAGPGIVDELERLQFKLSERGLRRGEAGRRRLSLPGPELDGVLIESYRARRSHREFAQEPMPFEQLALLLASLRQVRLDDAALPKYRYPSAGSLYPVQAHLYVKPGAVAGLAGGTYYYHPKHHQLVLLAAPAEVGRDRYAEINRGLFDQAAFALFLIGELDAIAPAYGDMARELCLLEAGYIGQLLMAEGPASGIGLCPVGTVDLDGLRPLFALRDSQVLLHSLLAGPLPRAERAGAMAPAAAAAGTAPPGALAPVFQAVDERELAAELRRFLESRLPSYMVPSAFMVLDALPLTATGKLDRRSLPAPSGARPAAPGSRTLRTPNEEIVAAILAQVLGVERLGAQDDFLALGGHSLLALRVVSRVREVFGVELGLRALFEEPTVARIAAAIDLELASAGGVQPPPIVVVPRQADLPVSFAQQSLWPACQLALESPAYNIASALRLSGRLDVAALQGSLRELVARHETLRTRFVELAGDPVQRIAPAAAPRLPLVDLGGLPGAAAEDEARRLAAREARQPFALDGGFLFRALLLRLGEGEHMALFTLHHLITDNWSMRILLRDVSTLYAAAVEGRPPRLPELAIQYADYACWQRQWLRGDVFDAHLAAWRRLLGSGSPRLALPIDRPWPAVPSYRGASRRLELGSGLARGLRELSQRQGVTLFVTLLAALQTLLFRYAGQDDISVGTPVAGRTHLQTEELIGLFVNTLVIRTDLGGDPTFLALLVRVREACLEAYTYREMPFERLVKELQPEREPGRPVLFQVMFNLQSSVAGDLQQGDLVVRGAMLDKGTALYDLTLELEEQADGITGWLNYSTDLFDEVTIAAMQRHFESLLTEIAADPGRAISELPMAAAEDGQPAGPRQAADLEEW
jgi:SagB-type dehydrogenase family enzyme